MVLVFGLLFVLMAGILQGSFYLPGTYTKNWEWEHTWTFFSLFAMIIFTWIFIRMTVPEIGTIYAEAPARNIWMLALFGGLWGVGAICTGLAMDRLGMALAFPIIMGNVAVLGSLIPLVTSEPARLFTFQGLILIVGLIVVIAGIVTCSRAYAYRNPAGSSSGPQKGSFAVNMSIAIAAGVMSSLLNIGFAYGNTLKEAAMDLGVPQIFAANTPWPIILTAGGVVNLLYCFYLMLKRGTFKGFFVPEGGRNSLLGISMGLIWCSGLYLYGPGAAKMGKLGVIVGWVLVMTINVLVGNLLGIFRGEWEGAPLRSRSLLNRGLAILIVAITIVAISNNI